MKAVFMSSAPENLRNVYSAEVRAELAASLDFIPDVDHFDAAYLDSRAAELREVDYIFTTWGMKHFTSEDITRYLPSLRAVFYGAGSVQGFAREFIDAGITVVSAWAANGVPVAEYTTAQIVLANKGYFQRFKRAGHQTWDNRGGGVYYTGNYGAKVGIIGAGMIGRLVIEMLKNYRLDVYVYDKFLSDEGAAALGVKKLSLPELFETCGVISNHLANNPQTVGMINRDCFERMAENAVFINTGRGAQVVEADLCDALREHPNRAALLDVTYPEPPEASSELYKLENVFLSPHIAGSLGREVERMGEYMLSEYKAFVEGRPLKYSVSAEMLKTMA